jgi:hypothetical protein
MNPQLTALCIVALCVLALLIIDHSSRTNP